MTADAMRAALGMPPEQAQPERLVWVDIEDVPQMIDVIDPVTGEALGRVAVFEDALGLTDLMADKARSVCDAVDEGTCEAADCVESPYERDGVPVGAGIGWVLAGEADERTEWRGVTLIQRKRKVIAVCTACSPSVLYEALWAE